MSGLIWAGIGQGIANAGRTMGDYMMREADREDRQEEQRKRDEERRAYEKERDALYRRTADQQAAGKSGGGDGLSPKSFAEGGENELMLAQRAGMTVPELRARDRLSMTGDTEPYKQDVTRYKPEVEAADTTDAVSRKYAKELGLTETVKELPPGFEAEAKAKAQTLAKIKESYVLGGKYDDVTKGRRNQQEVDMSEAALAQPRAAGVIGQAMAAGRGNDLVGGDSNVTRNKFTGDTSVTPVGEAERAKDLAQAEKTKREPTGKNEDLSTLQQMRKAAEETLKDARKALTEFDKANTGDLSRPGREKLKEQRDALAAEVSSARGELTKISDRLGRRLDETEAASKPAPAPAAGGDLPAPKTPEEVAKLKPGTRFRAPDGSIRYR